MTRLGHDEATEDSMDGPTGGQETTAVRRRTMLGTSALAGVGLIAVTATACGSSGSGGSPTVTATGGGAGGASTTGMTPGGGGGTQSSQQAAGTTLGPTSDVPVGGGKVYASHHVVVTQPQAGVYKGFSSTCTHAGCTVSGVSGGKISCPCHGSQFSATDGSVEHGPAQAPLPAKQISVQGGSIVLDS